MNKQTRAVFFFLIILVGILAFSTSFFAAKTFKKGSSNQITPIATMSASVGERLGDSSTTAHPLPAQSTEVTKAAAASEKPSIPADTYTVQKGETLFAIAQSQGLNWQDVAEANSITDADKIQAGQILVIPKGGQVAYTIDNTLAIIIQEDVDEGKYQFRLSPEETARYDSPSVYGLQVTDSFNLKDRNNEQGEAQVQASNEDKNYLIKLVQPVTKGEKGIWAIESIKPV